MTKGAKQAEAFFGPYAEGILNADRASNYTPTGEEWHICSFTARYWKFVLYLTSALLPLEVIRKVIEGRQHPHRLWLRAVVWLDRSPVGALPPDSAVRTNVADN